MKYTANFKKDTNNICSKLRTIFFVGEYQMNINFVDKSQEEETETTATININSKYLTFTIHIFPILQEIYNQNKNEFTEILTHEFSHLLTEPLYLFAVDAITNPEQKHLEEARERQTQRITNIIYPYLKKELHRK